MADQDFKMDLMFDDGLDESDYAFNSSKQNPPLPLYTQAMPNNFSFRPLVPGGYNSSAILLPDPPTPMKIESTPDLPTPAVLSTQVDVSKYEAVQHREWLQALPDYTGISPASASTFESSPVSEGVESFGDLSFSYGSNSWNHGHPNGMQFGRNHSIAPSITDGSSASPALSYDGFNQPYGSMSWSTSMFGQPDVVPPSRFHQYQPIYHHQPVAAAPEEIERPLSQHSDRALTFVPTMRSRQVTADDEAYVKRRDKMLIDLRRKGHSYKEIKRLGRFKEAESTLRGRLRTLTKEKSERVRKPKWNRRDV
jgi:hypothetical protein